MFLGRCAALAVLAGGCGDEGDDNGPIGTDGGQDAGADAGMDAGTDAGTDAGADGSLPEAGISELEAALQVQGVRTDRRRAELVLPLYCALYVLQVADAGTSAQCTQAALADFDLSKVEGDTEACIDASLDLSSCIVTYQAQAQTACSGLVGTRDTLCGSDGGV